MPVFNVNVKWGKEKFDSVECNTDEPPLVFKATLFSLSGVQPERQKIMIKGSVLKDDGWGTIKITNNANLLMMGSVDEIPQAPISKPVFLEDLNETQLARALELPAGLNNLGNTCYMNATLQCLRSVPELKDSMNSYKGHMVANNGLQPDESITAAIRDLFAAMDKTSTSIPPILMLNVLHMCFPQFAEKNDHGQYQQQDANECWTELIRCLSKQLPSTTGSSPQDLGAVAHRKGFVDQYFGGEFQTIMKCVESEDEAPTVIPESFYQLSCFIEKEVKYMHTGLKSGLEGEIVKNSPSLGRDSRYQKQSKITRLPAYLTIQMVRFYYKEKEAVNAKILKDIKYPLSLDVYDLCTSELQKKLIPARDRFKEEEDKNLERMQSDDYKRAVAAGQKPCPGKQTKLPYSFPDDVGSNNSGFYELQAVLTHKGRSSSSGHYVAWVRSKKQDEWLMFDDENVSAVTSEDILRLSGGGDWHCAYVLLYGPRILEVPESEAKESEEKKLDSGVTPMDS